MIIILVGNIGTGKSFYRNSVFRKGEKIICPDEWEHLDIKEKNLRYIKELHEFISKGDITTVIDGNNINRKARKKFIELAKMYNSQIRCVDFGPGSTQTLNRRLSQSPHEKDTVWICSHNGYKNKYEKPTKEEGFDLIEEQINYDLE